ncbi:MAG TPA: hypothetical protein VHL78_00660 [Actinomycetota bacterium]|nr:hypothetical protein [Actinomycetota bacterium]
MIDISSITLHFDSMQLDRVDLEARIEGYQLQGTGVPEGATEQYTKAAERLLNITARELKKKIREGLKG